MGFLPQLRASADGAGMAAQAVDFSVEGCAAATKVAAPAAALRPVGAIRPRACGGRGVPRRRGSKSLPRCPGLAETHDSVIFDVQASSARSCSSGLGHTIDIVVKPVSKHKLLDFECWPPTNNTAAVVQLMSTPDIMAVLESAALGTSSRKPATAKPRKIGLQCGDAAGHNAAATRPRPEATHHASCRVHETKAPAAPCLAMAASRNASLPARGRRKSVRFDMEATEVYSVTPYSEIFGVHPKYLDYGPDSLVPRGEGLELPELADEDDDQSDFGSSEGGSNSGCCVPSPTAGLRNLKRHQFGMTIGRGPAGMRARGRLPTSTMG
eukprot:gnl/TRDRNA2_/TRDRNA2_185399_c0_seq1.p1 gnl/TRDRNA2_/TRDRNA2_185399_c0~~gnl/TRDRNA2_/TRDRNA2_185399_c0_seq1.p1  ORF type:complete len:325 (-),score=34.87 gnl/TRDRNA2_/TRDRNA2_185399_c0_seq1:57-1031(-)